MSSMLLCHNLGLGDHFMCHGIVREYAKKYDRLGLFVKAHNVPTVSFMFRDIPGLTLHVGNDEDVKRTVFLNHLKFGPFWKQKYDHSVMIGFNRLDRSGSKQLERQFYEMAAVPFEKKWDSFSVVRDQDRERALEEKVHAPSEYIFIHDDSRFPIPDDRIVSTLPKIRPTKGQTDVVFDYTGLIERANEIHVMDSSFMFMIDLLPYINPTQRLVVHRYARPNPEWTLPILKKQWQILT